MITAKEVIELYDKLREIELVEKSRQVKAEFVDSFGRPHQLSELMKETIEAMSFLLNSVSTLASLVNSNWIPVERKLPDPSKYDWVLVQVKLVPEGQYSIPHVAELRGGIWYGMGYPENFPLEDGCGIKVTHWMPLPAYPKDIKGPINLEQASHMYETK